MPKEDRDDLWNLEYLIKDMLFETNLSFAEMSKRLAIPEWELHKKIKQYGLGWVRKSRRKMSRGHETLMHMIQKLLPGEDVVTEHCVGERLFLDVYCPSYKLAAEYHGRQHFHFSNYFYKDIRDFHEAQDRDLRKAELCRELGIALVTFRYDEDLNEDLVFDRMMDALKSTPRVKEERKDKRGFKGDHYYEVSKQRQRNWRKAQYREWKNRNKYDDRDNTE